MDWTSWGQGKTALHNAPSVKELVQANREWEKENSFRHGRAVTPPSKMEATTKEF